MTEAVTWNRTSKRCSLRARDSRSTSDVWYSPPEPEMDVIQAWCTENDCGRRMSYDEFRFRNEQEIIQFLLVWS